MAGKRDREYLGEKGVLCSVLDRMTRDDCIEQVTFEQRDTRSEPAESGAVGAGHGELQRQ